MIRSSDTFETVIEFLKTQEHELKKTDFGKKIWYLLKINQLKKLKKAWIGKK